MMAPAQESSKGSQRKKERALKMASELTVETYNLYLAGAAMFYHRTIPLARLTASEPVSQ